MGSACFLKKAIQVKLAKSVPRGKFFISHPSLQHMLDFLTNFDFRSFKIVQRGLLYFFFYFSADLAQIHTTGLLGHFHLESDLEKLYSGVSWGVFLKIKGALEANSLLYIRSCSKSHQGLARLGPVISHSMFFEF